MSGFNITGLASGIDTTSLISQLMQVAAQPQTQLKNQLATENNVISAYQSINTKLSAVQTAALDLKSSTTWGASTVASSDSSVLATASSAALAGSSATFNVTKVAQAQTSTFASTGGVVKTGGGAFTLSVNGTGHTITPSSGSATDVASAINLAGYGVRAAVVNTDSGQVLQLTSTSTGTNGAFTVTGLDGTQNDLVSAQNAQISVGDPLAGGYTVTSQTNTFANVVPGVTFSVSKLATNVTLSLTSDTKGIGDKVKAAVDSINAAYAEIGKDTAKGAVLASQTVPQRLGQSLLTVISNGVPSNGGSYSKYGINMDKNGVLTFDSAAFTAAFTADPTGTQAALGTALGGALNTATNLAIDPTKGSITTVIKSEQTTAANLTKSINSWTSRLTDMQSTMQQKYTAMESALSRLQSQSNWLTSALKGLDANNSSSSGH